MNSPVLSYAKGLLRTFINSSRNKTRPIRFRQRSDRSKLSFDSRSISDVCRWYVSVVCCICCLFLFRVWKCIDIMMLCAHLWCLFASIPLRASHSSSILLAGTSIGICSIQRRTLIRRGNVMWMRIPPSHLIVCAISTTQKVTRLLMNCWIRLEVPIIMKIYLLWCCRISLSQLLRPILSQWLCCLTLDPAEMSMLCDVPRR